MKNLVLAAALIGATIASAYSEPLCINPKAVHCICAQSGDSRAPIGYNPVTPGGQSIRVTWTCTDMDTMQVAYHEGRAFIASDPTVGVKMVSPGGGTYSSDFTPPE